VLAQSLRSYYAKDGTFTKRKLKGIKVKAGLGLHTSDEEIKESYFPPASDIRPHLLPESEKGLKRLRTKRRRIRNHFDGLDHLAQLAITVGWKRSANATLIGIKLRVSANNGMKALDASESYIMESVTLDQSNIVALSHALILPVQLMLNHIPTQVYYDSPNIKLPKEGEHSPYHAIFFSLSASYPNIDFIPSTKGPFVERLRVKLGDLLKKSSNEIVEGDIKIISHKFDQEMDQDIAKPKRI